MYHWEMCISITLLPHYAGILQTEKENLQAMVNVQNGKIGITINVIVHFKTLWQPSTLERVDSNVLFQSAVCKQQLLTVWEYCLLNANINVISECFVWCWWCFVFGMQIKSLCTSMHWCALFQLKTFYLTCCYCSVGTKISPVKA